MEKKQFIEIGKIINTHGVKGELKIESWADSLKTFHNIKTYYINEKAYTAETIRNFNKFVLIKFEGLDNLNDAMRFKEKVIYVKREDLKIPEGKILRCDIIGTDVIDKNTNKLYGKVKAVEDYPTSSVLVIETENGEVLLPNIKQFVFSIDEEKVLVTPIEGFFE